MPAQRDGSTARTRREGVRAPIAPGMRVGKYLLGDPIARGGMAEVWAAAVEGAVGFSKPVAIKFILDPLIGDKEYHRLFFNEAAVASELQHSNLVSVLDFDQAGADSGSALWGRYYIVMERVEGVDLCRLLKVLSKTGKPCAVGIALFITGEILKGLAYIHERRKQNLSLRLVHRDVSPQNVLVAYSGEVKLADFGIAKSLTVEHTGGIRGKLAYAAPELLDGVPPSQYSDQFAVGIILWETLAGRRLFAGKSQTQTAASVQRCEIPAIGRRIPAELEALARRMLAPRPFERFETTSDALTAVYNVPGYSADARPLGELLAFLFPDKEQRWESPRNVPHALQHSGETEPSPSPRDYPLPRPRPVSMAIDVQAGEVMPYYAADLDQPPFQETSIEEWLDFWARRGYHRQGEVYGPQDLGSTSTENPRKPK
jgi:serine/threonine protein kinase